MYLLLPISKIKSDRVVPFPLEVGNKKRGKKVTAREARELGGRRF